MRDALPLPLAPSRPVRTGPVALWLFACAVMVAAMVALGGLTRLTGSGLSMVEWNPHHILPPLSEAEWQDAFAAYRLTPEYALVNAGMSLAGFKGIFWLEYLHRLWGRLIAVVFALPLLVFVLRGAVTRGLALRLGVIFALGATQGGLGWYMVASGLADVPQVSHLRLAAHLVMAVLILCLLLWAALDLICPHHRATADTASARRLYLALAVLAALTVTWGAFVAGLHAGHIHTTFPLMDGYVFPQGGLRMRPALLNAIENPSAVQYVHRVLALTLLACLTLAGAWAWTARLPRSARIAFALAAAWAWMQAGLGIATLLLSVPVALAALHQMGAMVLVALLTGGLQGVRSG